MWSSSSNYNVNLSLPRMIRVLCINWPPVYYDTYLWCPWHCGLSYTAINYIYHPLSFTEELPSAKVDPRIVGDYNPITVESVCFALAGLIMQIESEETYYCGSCRVSGVWAAREWRPVLIVTGASQGVMKLAFCILIKTNCLLHLNTF